MYLVMLMGAAADARGMKGGRVPQAEMAVRTVRIMDFEIGTDIIFSSVFRFNYRY